MAIKYDIVSEPDPNTPYFIRIDSGSKSINIDLRSVSSMSYTPEQINIYGKYIKFTFRWFAKLIIDFDNGKTIKVYMNADDYGVVYNKWIIYRSGKLSN